MARMGQTFRGDLLLGALMWVGDPKTSLFARAQPRVAFPKTKEARGFLALPGEVRNRIYQYYFQDTYRCELVGEGCDFTTAAPKTIKLLSNTRTTKPRREMDRGSSTLDNPLIVRFPRLRRSNRTYSTGPRVYRGWLNPHGALILVCKQVHVETLPLLYQRITFVFEAPRRITNFILRVPKQNHGNVTKLHLHYATYGSPSAACHVVWQEKHIESWTHACKVASKSLACLRELEVDVWINEDAPKFNLRQKWLQPLLKFRRLTRDNLQGSTGSKSLLQKPHTLDSVRIRVKTRLWAHNFEMNIRLAKACKHLHRLYGQGISSAILGAKEEEAMAKFNNAWNNKYRIWQHHLGFARTGW
ncbi:hypothetical protein BU25DRAFT_438033 [Macroventuria anomochaeta]|uniref:Uncharacterized protein n=1 Tax=Macroventuria anomochaeta TaxID=301207 RepID=A0ACB6SA39_9PLEO|nr:uncharacterized protein BU25DRAFT_438033 [Macroventuria anomochaeta]KAF2630842.1 hypothetical protein BU25DRAFT_438033 [Macroventuria anomochaeta]